MEDGEAATGETGRYIRELAGVYKKNPKYRFSDPDRPEEVIRRVMNTVGKPGLPGENVRCVISVTCSPRAGTRGPSPTSWDFAGSEQPPVRAGGGQDPQEVTRTKQEDGIRFVPEYAQILGIRSRNTRSLTRTRNPGQNRASPQ